MNILIVEPDHQLASQYCSLLSVIGKCHEASNAQDAISAIDEHQPNVIVLELLLGKHNGIEFLYELRSYSDLRSVPVVLHTYVRPDQFTTDESLLHELGVSNYLYKPQSSLLQLKNAVQSSAVIQQV